jgi:hypothetical protein
MFSQDYWRGLILFGRNVASYKFSLGRALLDLRAAPGDLVKLDQLASPFAKNICEHLRKAPKQATSQSSRFLEACRKRNSGEIDDDKLRDATVALGFNNVIDAFHRLGPEDIPVKFFVDERKTNNGIRLTDELRKLSDVAHPDNLPHETEARWRLVETAWELGLNPSLIEYSEEGEFLYVNEQDGRIVVTSARHTLNGYQKGHCFYCFASISADNGSAGVDVDHFFAWSARKLLTGNINGVWNLVLSCTACNRGPGGKFDLVPSLQLVERLYRRNEHLIASHNPLRETLIMQTGAAKQERKAFLQGNYYSARTSMIICWDPLEQRGEAVF